MPRARDIKDPRPFHERIAADLRTEIMSGRVEPGANLPTTDALKKRFGASGATIQKAVGLLKEEGLLVGRAGSAVTVREHRRQTITPAAYKQPAEPGQPYRWIIEAFKNGMQGSVELLEVAEVTPPPDIQKALDLDAGEKALLRRQILSLDGEPAELVASYYPVSLAKGSPLEKPTKIKGGTPRVLADLGYPPVRCVDRVSADEPTQEQLLALELPTPLPVLRTFRVVYSANDLPIEATEMTKAGHLYELRYEF